MKIAGIDPSLTRTGIAIIDSATKSTTCHSIETKALPKLPKGQRHSLIERRDRLQCILESVFSLAGDAALIVIESPALSRSNAGTFERYGLWWLIADTFLQPGLRQPGTPIALVSPTTRCRWATGKGNATKDAVMLAVDRVWPGVASNNDEADALAFATMGAQWLGWPVPTLARHLEALPAVQWPTGEPADALRARATAAVGEPAPAIAGSAADPYMARTGLA